MRFAAGANLPSLFFQTDYALLSAPEDTTPVSTPSDYECDYRESCIPLLIPVGCGRAALHQLRTRC